MTNAITNDRFLTKPGVKQQNSDARHSDTKPPHAEVAGTDDIQTEVSRASQALRQEQETRGVDTALSHEQAGERLKSVLEQLGNHPRQGLAAHGQANTTLFEAAMAKPAA